MHRRVLCELDIGVPRLIADGQAGYVEWLVPPVAVFASAELEAAKQTSSPRKPSCAFPPK
jgi:hypothetical protein